MKTTIAAILVALTMFAQAQDAAVVVEEATYDPFPIPALPALKVPAKGRAIPYDRKLARLVRLPGAKPMSGKEKAQGPPVIKLAAAKTVKALTPFERQLLNDWDSPHGEAMNTLLRDIAAAKEVGNTNTYERLTIRYAAWAEKYLRRGSKPSTKQTQ